MSFIIKDPKLFEHLKAISVDFEESLNESCKTQFYDDTDFIFLNLKSHQVSNICLYKSAIKDLEVEDDDSEAIDDSCLKEDPTNYD